MRYVLAVLIFCVVPLISTAKKVKYLKLDFFHVVLVQVNGHLVNDSIALSFLKTFHEETKSRNAAEALDTITGIIKRNKNFFVGMYVRDLKRIIGHADISGPNFDIYQTLRVSSQPPIEHNVLIFWQKKGKVFELATPAYHEFVSMDFPRKGFKKRFFWKN